VDNFSRLSHLNGDKWKVEGEVNTTKETVKVRGSFEVVLKSLHGNPSSLNLC